MVAVPNTVADVIFTVTLRKGRRSCGLFGLMAAAAGGELVDLPGMGAHQRAPVVTVLAILMHVLARYAKVDRASGKSWASAWDELIGPHALRLTAPYDEVAFLQPPTNEPTSQQLIEAADLLLPNVEHEVKRTWSAARADEAIFSLIGSLSRPNVKDHRSSTRTGLCAALPSVDGTLGSEICSLLSAYDQLKLPAGRSAQARDLALPDALASPSRSEGNAFWPRRFRVDPNLQILESMAPRLSCYRPQIPLTP
jgi:hypothetical protein